MTSAAALFVQKPDKPRVWETVGASLRLMGEHPLPLLVPFGIVQALLTIERVVVGEVTPDGELTPVGLFLTLDLLEGLFAVLGTGATVVVVASLRRDKLLSPGEAFTFVFQRALPLFALAAMLWPLFLPAAFGGREAMDRSFLGFLLFVWIVPLYYLLLRFAVGEQLLLLEGNGPVEALRRSWRFMNGYRLRLLGIFVLEGLVGLAIGTGAWFAFDAAGFPEAAITVVVHLIGTPIAVFGTVAVTLYYLRIRETGVQREGAEYEPVQPA